MYLFTFHVAGSDHTKLIVLDTDSFNEAILQGIHDSEARNYRETDRCEYVGGDTYLTLHEAETNEYTFIVRQRVYNGRVMYVWDDAR